MSSAIDHYMGHHTPGYLGGQAGAKALAEGMARNKALLDPWAQFGMHGLPAYQEAVSRMANPQQYYQSLMHGYTQSPQAKLQISQATASANAAAAASGMLGSGAEQSAIAEEAQKRVAADQQQHFQNMNQLGQQYLSGTRGIVGVGQQAAGQEAQMNARMAQMQARYRQMQAQGAYDPGRDLWGPMLQGGIGLGIDYLTGGFGQMLGPGGGPGGQGGGNL